MPEPLLDRDDLLPGQVPALSATGFHVFAENADGVVLVRLEGELDMASAPRLGQVLNAELDGRASTIALDLTELAFLDSTGIRVLLTAHRRAAAQGCVFVLRFPNRSVLKVLQLTAVDRLMVIEPDPSSDRSSP